MYEIEMYLMRKRKRKRKRKDASKKLARILCTLFTNLFVQNNQIIR